MNKVTVHTAKTIGEYVNTVAPTPEAWNWYSSVKDGNVHIFEDTFLPEHTKYTGKKVALIIEVPDIYDNAKRHNPNVFHPFEWMKSNHQYFDYVMSPFLVLKDIVGEQKFIWVPAQECFIAREQMGLYEKERVLSLIASFKNWTVGHRMRHEIVAKFRNKLDVYGSGYNTHINDYGNFGKVIALAPYCFTIIVPNTKIDDFFSEQVTDAMSVGTIPIYCGTNGIRKHFNMDGVIEFSTIDELEGIINGLSHDLYNSKMAAVMDNLERAKQYTGTVDWLYNNKREFLESI